MTRASRARRLATAAAYGGGGLGSSGRTGHPPAPGGPVGTARVESRTAKADPPTGEGRYGHYRGKQIVLAVLGDSSAVGLGVDRAEQTPGVLIASALAELAERPVRLVKVAVSGHGRPTSPGRSSACCRTVPTWR